MPMLLFLALQSAPVSGPASPVPVRPRTSRECPAEAGGNGDVVVCGRRNDEEFRLKPLSDRYERDSVVPRAAFTLPGGAKAAETEQTAVDGFPSKRIMLRLKLPF